MIYITRYVIYLSKRFTFDMKFKKTKITVFSFGLEIYNIKILDTNAD